MDSAAESPTLQTGITIAKEFHFSVRYFTQPEKESARIRALIVEDATADRDLVVKVCGDIGVDATAHQMLAYSIRHRYPMSLIIIDLDHFKRINDEHGHAVGDKVLKAVGHLLKTRCREEDLAARFGGEEFIVVLPHCSLSNARNKAEFLRTTLEELRPAGLAVTASFGVCCTQNGESIEYEEFFRQADQALYQAKEQGRNRVVCFAPALDYSD